MANMTSDSVSSKKYQKSQEPSVQPNPSLDEINGANRNSVMMDEDSDEDEEYQFAEPEQEVVFYFFFHIAELFSLSMEFIQIADIQREL